MERKLRPPKETDQINTEKAFQLLRQVIESNSQIEPTLWAGAAWSVLVNGYLNENWSYKQFCEECESVKEFYKDRWNDYEHRSNN